MDHTQATALFTAYWDKDLAPEESSRLEEHLRSCVVCRREYEQFEKTVGVVHGLEKVPAPPQFARGVIDRVRQRSAGRFFSPQRMVDRIPYELFSLVMLGIVLVIYLFMQMSQPGKVNIP